MASLGYVGEIVDQEEVAGNGQVRRLNGNGRTGNGRKVSEEKLTKITQAVTMAVLVALGEAKKFSEEEEIGKNEGSTLCMKVMMVLIGCVCCYLIPVAAVLRIKRLRVERERRKEGMAEEHSEMMEQRVGELAEMRQGATDRRERLLQENVLVEEENAPKEEEKENDPKEEEKENAPKEEEKKNAPKEEDTQEESEEEESKTEDEYSSSSSTEAEEPKPSKEPEKKEESEGQKEAEKPNEGEGQEDDAYLHLSEEGLWTVTKQSASIEEENRMVLEGENALNMDFARSERLKQIFSEFQTRMKQPAKQLPNDFGNDVKKWEVEAMDLLTDLRDSEDIVNSDLDEVERRFLSARKKYEKKKDEIAESLKVAEGLKKEMEGAEKEFQEAKEEVKDFQTSKDVVKGVVVMMQTAGEVMRMLIHERPEFARLYAKKRERVSLYDLIKRKRESDSEIEPMGKASEKKTMVMEPKTKAMPKRIPSPLRKNEEEQKKQKTSETPRWDPRKQNSCFFCGETTHKAMNCEAMAQQALNLGGIVPSREDRVAAGSSLFCKCCYLTSKEDPRSKMCGWGNHTHQRCRNWKAGDREEQRLAKAKEMELEKNVPKAPNPKWRVEPTTTKRKAEDAEPKAKAKAKGGGAYVEEVEDDEESEKKQDDTIDLMKEHPKGFPKEELEEAKKQDEVKKAMQAKAKASKEGKKRGSKDAKKKSEKNKKEKKEKKSKKKDEAKEANINAEDL